MRRTAKILAAVAAALVVAVAGFAIAGRAGLLSNVATALTNSVLGNDVRVKGLGGSFPDNVTVTELALRDAKGVYARLQGVTIDWSPGALFHGVAHIDRLHADRLDLLRLPEASGGNGGGKFSLPVGVDIDALKIDRIALSEAVAKQKAALSLHGQAHLVSLQEGSAELDLHRLDGPGGSYAASGKIDTDTIAARVAVNEPAHGLIATVMKLPDLGALALRASMDGPRTGETARLALAAGQLRLDGKGTLDLDGRRMDLTLAGRAPAMAPAPDIAWKSATLDAHVKGTFNAPDATGVARIEALSAGAARAHLITADLAGNQGQVTADVTLEGLAVPGPKPDLLAGAPVKLRAAVTLDAPTRPVTLTLSHPLLNASARATTRGGVSGTMALRLPTLKPFAEAAKLDLAGHANLSGTFAATDGKASVAATGTLGITGGMPEAVQTIGGDAKIALSASRADGVIRLDRAAIDGKAMRASVQGTEDATGALALSWTAALTRLAAIVPTMAGEATAHGTVQGPPTDLAVAADATVNAAVGGLPKQKVVIRARLHGLPSAPSGSLTAEGQFAGAPLRLAADVARAANGTVRIGIDHATWKSAAAHGTLTLPPGAAIPTGQMQLAFARLSDLAPLVGQPVAGSLTARLDTVMAHGAPAARVDVNGDGLAFAGTVVANVTLTGTIDRLSTSRDLALDLTLDGIRAQDITGRATLALRGPATRPALQLAATLNPPGKGAATVAASATADTRQSRLRLTALRATWQGETARLARPATVSFANGLAIAGLRIEAGKAVAVASGRVSPTLDLDASVQGVTPKMLAAFAPSGAASAGTMSMTAHLGGTLAAPTGTVTVNGRDFRGWAATTSPLAAGFQATARLHGSWAEIEASFSAGNTATLRVAGRASLDGTGTLDLTIAGRTDLALLDPFLLAEGRRARGTVTLDVTARGTLDQPRLAGTARLADGEIQDYIQGVHITDIAADVEMANGVVRIARFIGKAGAGTVAVSGTVQLLAPGMPVDIVFTAKGAKLPARDLVTAIMDAEIHLRGAATSRLDVAGRVRIEHTDIQLPDHLPEDVAVLDVRKPGEKAPQPQGPAFLLGLDITVDAPERIFVRGHGLDAEMGGSLRITGTTASPVVNGGFLLRRGSYSIAGKTLNFVSGRVSFDGRSLTGDLNPTLDFVAENTNGNVTARLEITGYADDPKFKLTSSPELPQDEMLAHLLFAKSLNELTPIEIAQIGSALASLGGAGGGFNPLAEVRKGLGLDVLSVGGAGSGGTSVEAGKYVASGVYVGTKQGLSGSSQAEVKIDLTEHLKLETELSAKSGAPLTGATPTNDPGSSVGLTYQFEY